MGYFEKLKKRSQLNEKFFDYYKDKYTNTLTEIYKDPTPSEFSEAGKEYNSVRLFLTKDKKTVYAWSGYAATHNSVAIQMKLGFNAASLYLHFMLKNGKIDSIESMGNRSGRDGVTNPKNFPDQFKKDLTETMRIIEKYKWYTTPQFLEDVEYHFKLADMQYDMKEWLTHQAKKTYEDKMKKRIIVVKESGESANTTTNIGGGDVESVTGVRVKSTLPPEEIGSTCAKPEEEEIKESVVKPSGYFAGSPVFVLDDSSYENFRKGKIRYHRWDKYLDMSKEECQCMYKYAKQNPGRIIIVANKQGLMYWTKIKCG